jgi:succinoglycan biosynthesis protein ExoO
MLNSVSPSVDVTVVIAAYNAASFIDRAITSVLEQQGCSLDIVVVDDASDDDTIGVVQRRAEQDPRLRLITLPQNSGPASARNAGFSAARGRWIAVLDADDAFEPGRLEHLVTAGDTLGLDIVADNFRLFDVHAGASGAPALRESAEVFIVTPASFAEHARPFSPETDWGLLKPMFRSEYVAATGLRYKAGMRHGEDFEIILDALCQGGHYGISRKPGYLYTDRSSGHSRTVIDFSGQISSARERAAGANEVGDEALATALQRRAAALATIDLQYRIATLLRAGKIAAFLQLIVREPATLPTLLRQIVTRLRSS